MTPEVLESEDIPIGIKDNSEPINGKDPGPCIKDPESIKDLSEIELCLQIRSFDYLAWFVMHQTYEGRTRISDDEAVDIQKKYFLARDYCVYQTKRFGTGVEGYEEGKPLSIGEDFFKWYGFFKSYIDNMSQSEYDSLQQAIKKGKSLKKFLPKGNWRDYELSETD